MQNDVGSELQRALQNNINHLHRVVHRAGSNGIDIEVSRHHTVSVSNFKSIEVSTDDGPFSKDTRANSMILFSTKRLLLFFSEYNQ